MSFAWAYVSRFLLQLDLQPRRSPHGRRRRRLDQGPSCHSSLAPPYFISLARSPRLLADLLFPRHPQIQIAQIVVAAVLVVLSVTALLSPVSIVQERRIVLEVDEEKAQRVGSA